MKPAALLWTTSLLGIALGGCLSAPAEETAAPLSRPGEPQLGAASGLPVEPRVGATLDEPPAWRLGEWWRTRFSAPPYRIQATFDQVVAGVHGDAYLVGVDLESFDDGVLLLHFPGLGEVNASSLGFDAHDRPFVPLQFPLHEGATWDTQWYTGAPLTARVTRAVGSEADVQLTGVRSIQLTYDAQMGAIRRFEIAEYGGFEVVEHGYGYDGVVRIPAQQDLVFCHGRAMVVQAVDLCVTRNATEPRPPRETLQLPNTYDRASFGLFLRDLQAAPVAPGVLHIEVVAPNGQVYRATKTPDRTGMVLYPYGLEDPGGTWQVTAVAGGAGLAILEGVAYRVLDVDLVSAA